MPDQEAISGQLKLLETYRRRLRIQLDQQGRMGTFAPAYLQIEIDEARANIQKIKRYLHSAGVAVDDLPEDSALPMPAEPLSTKTAPPPAQEPSPPGEAADVYISYHPADKPWVRGTLLPLIEQNGLRAIVDWRDFAIGVPKITNMENAVANSRQTLLVLTPEWVASEWNSFQELLASTADPAGVRGKLLPVKLRQCELPPRLAMREAADLSDPAERNEQLARVMRALRSQVKREPGSEPHAAQALRATPSSPPTSADFVVVTALEEERDAVLAHLPGSQRIMPSQADVRTYRYARVPVAFPDATQGSYGIAVLSLISMGRVEASLATADAIRRWQPRYVLMVGIAGGVEQAGVRVGDVLVSNQVIDYELQKLQTTGEDSARYSVHRADPRLLDAAQNLAAADWLGEITSTRPSAGQPKRLVGPIATGDKVIARKAFLDRLLADWPKLIGVEMEAGGAAAAAFQAATAPGFFMVRGVSDLANEDKGAPDVEQWRAYACDVAAAYTIALLKSGPVPVR